MNALISVYDKIGVVEFARVLHDAGAGLISTGGTHRTLSQEGLPVRQVSDLTGFPEILDGRVKTLHPRVHGALLALRDSPAHMEELGRQEIEPIDLVVGNLYPFTETISKPGVTLDDALENIDIGGPTMLRAGAKNFSTSPSWWTLLTTNGSVSVSPGQGLAGRSAGIWPTRLSTTSPCTIPPSRGTSRMGARTVEICPRSWTSAIVS